MASDISTSADVIDVRDIIERFEDVVAAAQAVVQSADDTGCSDDLTVVSQRAIEQLQEALWQIRQ